MSESRRKTKLDSDSNSIDVNPIESAKMESVSWTLIDKYFKENPYNLVAHHLDSYNDFFSNGIFRIFRENNPLKVVQKLDEKTGEEPTQAFFYMGGKTGNKIYFGKPVIYDSNDNIHYMYPNQARLRNMSYGMSIHYDVDVEIVYYENQERKVLEFPLNNIYLGNFPIMVNSNLCILNGLATDVRFNMGECRNDYGGYFIIDGKEKSIICQETRADNMLYTKVNKENDASELYSHVAEIRSVSEDASKPMRTSAVKIVAPTSVLSNGQIVVEVPNVRKPVPLFILMRALGVLSDQDIIKYCLLDLNANSEMMDLFIPSIHDASKIFNQVNALQYISTFTKRQTISNTLEILMNAFLPHVGELNFLDKAYFVGYMVYKLLKLYTNQEKPTNRDNFKYKRIELTGALLYDLFREYYLIQSKKYMLVIEKSDYFKNVDITKFIQENQHVIFKERIVEKGFRKAFKGNWGSQANTKRIGVVQDLNRLSWFTFISQLRRINLPLSASAKVVGPHLLNNSQWGYIDPIDTPDGGNIGLHKHLAISCVVTDGFSAYPLIKLLRENTEYPLKILQECSPEYLATATKVFVNGNWIGVVVSPIELVSYLKLLRRNGAIPIYTSITFSYEKNEIYLYTDSGRLIRPIYYINDGVLSINREGDAESKRIHKQIADGDFNWNNVVSGFNVKKDKEYSIRRNKVYKLEDLYAGFAKSGTDAGENHYEKLIKFGALVDYIDVSEEENTLIANNDTVMQKNRYYTNVEIHSSLMFGVLGNSVIYPENNPLPRNQFSCGQSKQAVSVYHTNSHLRFDKMGVVLNYGQTPLIKSRYLEYINKEEHPYGVNAIVAIMTYTGYNVEDAILINEGSVKRGLFNTTYFTMYESTEETMTSGESGSATFSNILSDPNVVDLKLGYDYSVLDDYGLVKKDTEVHDKMVMIGRKRLSGSKDIPSTDDSVTPKKGQLGIVDKVFMTDSEDGNRLAKVRIREQRTPAIGDKMASRAGQKGTIGLIIPEEDMPFTEDGLRPDLIINPHALPSRMTIGQLVECLLGKVCTLYGSYGDCTAFAMKGANYDTYGPMLTKLGFNNSGNQLLYSGYTGEQLEANVFIGPTYYMRLKHMVKDKINARGKGPRTMLTRQTVQGRANDGGLRIGEMERDGILAHGASAFLNDSYMVRGDQYYMAICNKTGMTAIYNESLNLFLSPYSDGPIDFSETVNGTKNIKNISRFGRSFSIIRVPYSLKLLMQELQTMNIQMRIITDANVDQLMNLRYSDNVGKLLQDDNQKYDVLIHTYSMNLKRKINTIRGVSTIGKSQEEIQEIVREQNALKQQKADEEHKWKQDVMQSVRNSSFITTVNRIKEENLLLDAGWVEIVTNIEVVLPSGEQSAEPRRCWYNIHLDKISLKKPDITNGEVITDAQQNYMSNFIRPPNLESMIRRIKDEEVLMNAGWVRIFSTDEMRDYWYNKEKDKIVYEKPIIRNGKVLTNELAEGWEEYTDFATNTNFWYNEKLNKTVWKRPLADAEEEELEEEWEEYYSEKQQRAYWYNKKTDQSVWTKPEGFVGPAHFGWGYEEAQQAQPANAPQQAPPTINQPIAISAAPGTQGKSQFTEPSLNEAYLSLKPQLQAKVDDIPSQEDRDQFMRSVIEIKRQKAEKALKDATEAAKKEATGLQPTTQANILEVSTTKEKPEESEKKEETSGGSSSSSSDNSTSSSQSEGGTKRVIKIG